MGSCPTWIASPSYAASGFIRLIPPTFHASRLPHLEGVIIGGRNLADTSSLAGLKSLRHLRMTGCRFEDLTPLEDLADLEAVELWHPGTPSGTTSLEPLRHATKLTQLILHGFRLGPEGIDPVVGLPRLGILGVDAPDLTEADLTKIAAMPRLDRLDLHHAAVRTLEPLAPSLPRLHFLTVTDAPLDDEGVGCLRAGTWLVTLDLRGAKITDRGLAHLTGLINVTRLDLGGTRVGGRGLGLLGKLKFLEYLNLSDTPTDDSGLASLAGYAYLEELLLADTNVTDAGLAQLARQKSLRSVDLSGTETSRAGRDRLLKALPGLKVHFRERSH